MASLTDFAADMARTAKVVERQARIIIRDVAASIVAELVARTPVGGPPTSPHDPHPRLARSNWSARPGDNEAVNLRQPEDAAATIARARAAPPADTYTISNPTPYLSRLNEGSSTQAPAGFIEAGIADGAARVPDVNILVE